MIYYVVIELLEAGPEDYEKLDGRMILSGFGKTAKSKKGDSYNLSRGVYRSQCRRHASDVMDIARAAANSTGCKNELMTIEAADARWFPNVGSETA